MADEEARRRRDALQDKANALQLEIASEEIGKRRFLSLPDVVRRWAALLIILFYGGVLFVALIIFYQQGHGCLKDFVCAWDKASANALELIKIGIMPVITLVIGYYFGKSDK